jgi:hypothetical protein
VDFTDARWRKSSFSGEGENGSGCVEIAFLAGGHVALRDTKDRSRPPHCFNQHEWRRFLSGVHAGEFTGQPR